MIVRGGIPIVGFGAEPVTPPPATTVPSPWTVALATSVLSAAAGWTIEEVARKVRGKRR